MGALNLARIVGGLVLIAGSAFMSMKGKETTIENFIPKDSQVLFEEKCMLHMCNLKERFLKTENLDISGKINPSRDKIYLEICTQNYNNPNWGAKEIHRKKYTEINDRYTRMYVIHPKKMKVSLEKQVGYQVPQKEWIKLHLHKEDKTGQLMIKGGQMVIDGALSLLSLPFSTNDLKERLGDFAPPLIEGISQKDYTLTCIPQGFKKKAFGSTIVAKGYEIKFDRDNSKEDKIYLWVRLALGNPSQNSSNAFPNRYGVDETFLAFILPKKLDEKLPRNPHKIKILSSNKTQRDGKILIEKNGIQKIIRNENRGAYYGASLSPDGEKIAFYKYSWGNWKIHLSDTEGNLLNKMERTNGNNERDSKILWDPNGEGIIKKEVINLQNGQIHYKILIDEKSGREKKLIGMRITNYEAIKDEFQDRGLLP